jgi:hypothetical protein
MSTTITITKSIDVEIEATETERGDTAWTATVPATDYTEARVIARATIYERDAAPDGSARFTVSGCFVDNYAVERKALKAVDGVGVSFDSEQGQFFAYTSNVVTAEMLARIVVTKAVEVALEAGEL